MTFIRTAALVAALAVLPPAPAAAAQRAYVASNGSDANTASSCGLSTPCRGFQAAMSVVDAGGEILALDTAGYGAVVVDKSVSIVGNSGFYAGISVSSGAGVTIATPGVDVTLRGLNINAIGGAMGVTMSAGSSLAIENCVISNFSSAARVVSTGAKVRVADTTVRRNAAGLVFSDGASAEVVNSRLVANTGAGLRVLGNNAAAITSISVTRSVSSQNDVGFIAFADTAGATARLSLTQSMASGNTNAGVQSEASGSGTAVVLIGYSTVSQNGIGLAQVNAGSSIVSTVNNVVELNTTDIAGTVTNTSTD